MKPGEEVFLDPIAGTEVFLDPLGEENVAGRDAFLEPYTAPQEEVPEDGLVAYMANFMKEKWGEAQKSIQLEPNELLDPRSQLFQTRMRRKEEDIPEPTGFQKLMAAPEAAVTTGVGLLSFFGDLGAFGLGTIAETPNYLKGITGDETDYLRPDKLGMAIYKEITSDTGKPPFNWENVMGWVNKTGQKQHDFWASMGIGVNQSEAVKDLTQSIAAPFEAVSLMIRDSGELAKENARDNKEREQIGHRYEAMEMMLWGATLGLGRGKPPNAKQAAILEKAVEQRQTYLKQFRGDKLPKKEVTVDEAFPKSTLTRKEDPDLGKPNLDNATNAELFSSAQFDRLFGMGNQGNLFPMSWAKEPWAKTTDFTPSTYWKHPFAERVYKNKSNANVAINARPEFKEFFKVTKIQKGWVIRKRKGVKYPPRDMVDQLSLPVKFDKNFGGTGTQLEMPVFQVRGKVQISREQLKTLAADLYKGNVGALPRLKKAVEEYGAEDVAQAVRSTYTEGSTPGYKKLRPEIDKILDKPEVVKAMKEVAEPDVPGTVVIDNSAPKVGTKILDEYGFDATMEAAKRLETDFELPSPPEMTNPGAKIDLVLKQLDEAAKKMMEMEVEDIIAHEEAFLPMMNKINKLIASDAPLIQDAGMKIFSNIGVSVSAKAPKTTLNLFKNVTSWGRGWDWTKGVFGYPAFLAEKFPLIRPAFRTLDKEIKGAYSSERKLEMKVQNWAPKGVNREGTLKALVEGDKAERMWTAKELVDKFALDRKSIEYYNVVRMGYVGNLNVMHKSMLLDRLGYNEVGLPAVERTAIRDYVDGFFNNKGWIDRTRWGKWGLKYKDIETGIEWFSAYESKSLAKKAKNDLKKNGFEVVGDIFNRSKEQITQNRLNKYNVDPYQLDRILVDAGIERTRAIKMMRDYVVSKSKMGLQQHMLRRRKVPGADESWTGITEGLDRYMTSVLNMRIRENARKNMSNYLKRLPRGMEKRFVEKYMAKWFDKNYTKFDRASESLRRFMAWYYLGYKLTFPFQNMHQPITHTYPEIMRYLKSEPSSLATFTKGYKTLLDIELNAGRTTSKETVKAYKEAVRKGVVTGEYTAHLLGAGETGTKFASFRPDKAMVKEFRRMLQGVEEMKPRRVLRELKELTYTSGAALGAATEYSNRALAFLSFHDVAGKLGLKGVEKFNFARDRVSTTQLTYGRHNLPLFVMNSPTLRALHTFVSFQGQTLQRISRAHRGGNIREALHIWGHLTAVAGIRGLPFASTIAAIFHAAGVDMDEVKDYMGIENDTKTTDALEYGLWSLAGINASGQLGMDFLSMNAEQDLLRAPGGLWKKGKQAYELITVNNDAVGAAFKMSMPVTSYGFEGVKMWETGTYNNPITNKFISQASKYSAILKMAGFTSVELTKGLEVQSRDYRLKKRVQERSKKWSRRMSLAINEDKLNPDSTNPFKRMDAIAEEVRIHNEKVDPSHPEDYIVLDAESIREQTGGMQFDLGLRKMPRQARPEGWKTRTRRDLEQ